MMRALASSLRLVLALAAGPAAAATASGQESFDFLNLDVDARAAAMGGAYVTRATNANALQYNPAGLAFVRRHELTLMHHEFMQGVTQDYAALAIKQGVGAQANLLRSGKLQRTTYSKTDGSLGSFSVDDLSAGLGYGYAPFESLGFGLAAKYLSETHHRQKVAAYAGDAGLLYSSPDHGLRFGAAVQNVGPDAKFQVEKERLPAVARAGASYSNSALTIALDGAKGRSTPLRLAAGMEATLGRGFALRLGFNSRVKADVGISGGAGWSWRHGSFDYAFQPYGPLGLAHRLSLTARWGWEGKEPDQLMREYSDKERPWWKERSASPLDEAAVNERLAEARDHVLKGRQLAARDVLFRLIPHLSRGDKRLLRAHLLLGDSFFRSGDCAMAEEHFLEGIRMAEAMGQAADLAARAHESVGRCYERTGRYVEALEYYYSSARISPNDEIRARIQKLQSMLAGESR